ncbi:MAG: Hsp20/alpha crystallin family protein [Planctomycetota bacterium]
MNQCCQTDTPAKQAETVYRPSMDIIDTGGAYEIRLDVPGSSRDAIDVTIDEGVLTVEAEAQPRSVNGGEPVLTEFGVGPFRRRVRLGEDVDRERLTASYDLGVLTLTLPKRAEVGPKRIEITTG